MEENKLIAEFMGFRKVSCIRSENGKYFDYSLPDGFDLILEEEIEIESQLGWGLVSKDTVFISDLIFHSDWNWLMAVVDKIESFVDDDKCAKYNFIIEQSFVEIIDNNTSDTIVETDEETKMKSIYQAVIKFIKWYEQNSN
jgi:hypothetical protein